MRATHHPHRGTIPSSGATPSTCTPTPSSPSTSPSTSRSSSFSPLSDATTGSASGPATRYILRGALIIWFHIQSSPTASSRIAQYIYGTYLGLSALPFLARTTLLLAPLLPLGVAYVVSLLGFNVARWVLSLYFGVWA